MEFISYECEVALNEGFTEQKDIFQRKPFATALTGILEKSSRSLSLMIDARWGEGKTTFLKMWAGELGKTDFPVIYFDAFKTDYCSDPFEALSASITDFVAENLSGQSALKNKIVKHSASRLKILSKAGLKIGAQALVHHIIGDEAATTVKEIESKLAESAEKGIESFWKKEIRSFARESESIEQLKAAISEIPKKYGAGQKPLIFIIDELDRCKPSYSIALLERIKHFMAADNVHYVHAVNYQQLAASASAIYGQDIDAGAYFQKFFDFKFALPTSTERAYYKSSSAIYAHRLFAQNVEKFEFFRQYSDACNTFAHLTDKIQPSLRALERINDQLILAYSLDLAKHSFIHTILISSIFIKHCNQRLYEKLLHNNLEFSDIESFLNMKYSIGADYDDEADHAAWYTLCSWGRCLKTEIPEEDRRMREAGARTQIRDFPNFPVRLAQKYIEQFNMQ
ncbi:MAG: P-loop NTPase fold protein [Pseudomonadota bacterium]